MKTRYQMTRPLGDLIDKAISEKSLMPSKHWSIFDDIEASFYARQRPHPAPAPAPAPIAAVLQPFSIETDKFFIPFNPRRYKHNKKGELKEEKMPMQFLAVSAGSLKLRIFKNSDPGTVIRRSHEIRRRCGDAAAKLFLSKALGFVKPKEEKPDRKPMANPFHVESSGICNRFMKGKMQSEIGSQIFEYKNSEQAEKDILKTASLAEALSASAAMRKAFNSLC